MDLLKTAPDLDGRRILLMRTDRIGDLLVTTPSFRALRATYPQARFDLCASPLNIHAVDGHPQIGTVYAFSPRRVLDWLPLLYAVHRANYAAIFNFSSQSRSTNVLLRCLRSPLKIACNGVPGYATSWYTHDLPAPDEIHVVRAHLGRLTGAGFTAAGEELEFFLPDDVRAAVHSRFAPRQPRPRVAFFLGNIKKIHNRWGVERFVELVKRVHALDLAELVLLAGKADIPLLDAFADVPESVCRRFVGTTLQESAALLAACDLLVTSSSGPWHLASAMGCPTIGIVTHFNRDVWRTLGPRDICITPPTDTRDMREVPVEPVFDAVRNFLEQSRSVTPCDLSHVSAHVAAPVSQAQPHSGSPANDASRCPDAPSAG